MIPGLSKDDRSLIARALDAQAGKHYAMAREIRHQQSGPDGCQGCLEGADYNLRSAHRAESLAAKFREG